MRRTIGPPAIAMGLSVLCALGLGVWALSLPLSEVGSPRAKSSPAPERSQNPPSSPAARVEEHGAPSVAHAAPEEAPNPSERQDSKVSQGASPLEGLLVRGVTEADRQNLEIPKKWSGVVVTKVEPNSGADQIELRVNDVIVRAKATKVESEADLQRVVAGSDRTLLTIVRDGFLFQRVLRSPYRKPVPDREGHGGA